MIADLQKVCHMVTKMERRLTPAVLRLVTKEQVKRPDLCITK